ncbi:hypothetical protein [Chitiniphilus eburneus]|uniref:hypothetical protein n=1 Tax=Chitiniphilus eburneus TaxID=2571148 RepID=UPI0035CFD38F
MQQLTKICHAYNPATGAYLGPTLAYLSPLEPGVYPLPAGATYTAPPAPKGGKWPHWLGDAWELRAVAADGDQ